MSKFEVLGISGKAGTGKDFLTNKYLKPLGYKQFSLAWHFKVGIVGEGKATHEEVFVTKPPHVRKALQMKGTEEGRDVFGEDVWCNHVREWFDLLHEMWGIDKFVIPDIRFINEVKFVQNMGGKVFRIHAPKRMEANSLTVEQRKHISETALDEYLEFDGIIYNDPEHIETVKRQLHIMLGEEQELYTTDDTTLGEWIGDWINKVVDIGNTEIL